MRTTEEYKELKNKILSLLNEDEEFAFEIYKIIIEKYGKQLLTKTYLDEALLKLSKEFLQALQKQSEDLKREFYQALQKQSEEFDKKLQKQSEEFDKKLQKQSEEFDKKLQKQSEEFDKKLQKQSEDLKKFIDARIGILGERWGMNSEITIRNFAEEIIKNWGGSVKKWKKKIEQKVGNTIVKKSYEIDIIITDGKEILVEVKSSCDKNDVEKFLEATAIYEEEVGRIIKEKIIVTFFAREDAKILAEEYGIKIIQPL